MSMHVGRPLNLVEKLLANAVIGDDTLDAVGSVILIKVDWILSSELSWAGMDKIYTRLGRPQLPNPSRFWLAADHIVDPRVNHRPQVRAMIDAAERIAREAKGMDYQPPNQTIMHTEFTRERVQPGQIVIGSDSHTCSSGSMGAFAMGLGTTDVIMALVTGRTWIKAPETVQIRLVGKPPLGVGGKDVILYILGKLKRNTVAAERAVEFSGPGLEHLSIDARFAICNMTTEFGGITGVCVPDAVTLEYINRRVSPEHRSSPIFFRPDEGATYVETHVIDLSEVSSLVALYPSPDNVVPATEVETDGLALDGVFIGACTTAYEDLVLGALVLEAGLKGGLRPSAKGHRKVTPGSVQIISSLRRFGLTDVYEQAGFEVGVPGCSYCIGMSADVAGEGETWLSSQNRNFRNRMGKGSIGNLASAATVAASSFDMRVRDPAFLLNKIDVKRFNKLCGSNSMELLLEPTYTKLSPTSAAIAVSKAASPHAYGARLSLAAVSGKVQRFGNDVDTDSISPADKLMEAAQANTEEAVGECCFVHDRPEFRQKAKEGYNIVVAGSGFGCGSSRETAAVALKGTGVKAVIAPSFAYIFRRNTANNGLPAIQIEEPSFYSLVDELGEEALVTVDFAISSVDVAGRHWPFKMAALDLALLKAGGVLPAYKARGSAMYDV